MTTVQPTRQDLANKVSLSGKVTINPVFGIVAPVAGQVRYLDVETPQRTPSKPTRVATIWASGKAHRIEIPAGAVFAGRLVDDRSNVTAGMPIVSAKKVGYGLVADIDGEQAYKISDALATVQAQIKSGPGPFPCKVLGTIAALPAGTIPDPPAAEPSADPSAQPSAPPVVRPGPDQQDRPEPSEPTGMRLVCTAPAKVKLINGASATLEVVTARAAKALVLPVEAVAGGQGRGKVDVVQPDGTRETRDVVLGLSDGKVVQIKSGLTGDETVAVPGPNLPPAKPGGEGDPTGPMGGK
ncbi:efflux RND transporter periplasmic adaptor subunit [Micromonospora sp. SL4-19]|uniref:efflux RND transporter periplasmic adaptor subunit n=1 Tax=Micromonospora sp. SL4-19 TaxID=3399129 RepID=UPI003A4E2065